VWQTNGRQTDIRAVLFLAQVPTKIHENLCTTCRWMLLTGKNTVEMQLTHFFGPPFRRACVFIVLMCCYKNLTREHSCMKTFKHIMLSLRINSLFCIDHFSLVASTDSTLVVTARRSWNFILCLKSFGHHATNVRDAKSQSHAYDDWYHSSRLRRNCT